MIKVNLRDGQTLAFDLNREEDQKQWLEWSSVTDFQNRISGIGILHNGKFHTLPFPKKFNLVRFYAELVYNEKNGVKRKVGEKLICHADYIKLEIMVYTYDNPPPPISARIDLRKVGKQMFPGQSIDAIGD